MRAAIEIQAFNVALEAMWTVVRAANAYVDHQAPWTLAKTDTTRMGTVLYVMLETIRHLATLGQPYMPDSCAKMLDQLALDAGKQDFAALGPDHALAPGTALPKPQGIFPRIIEEKAAS